MKDDEDVDFSKLPGFYGEGMPSGKITLGYEDGTKETLEIPEAEPITEEDREFLKELITVFCGKFSNK